MAPSGWATEAEKSFLFLQLPDYIKRVAAGKVHLFWGSVLEGFLQKFPEHAKLGLLSAMETGKDAELTPQQRVLLDEAIKARRKQIETWFRYQKKKLDNKPQASGPEIVPSLERMLFSAPKRRRGHQAIEVFQKRHAAEIRQALQDAGYDEITENDVGGSDTDSLNNTPEARAAGLRSLRMQLRWRVVKQMFESLNEDEMASINDQLEAEKAEFLKGEAEKKQDKKTPAGLQLSIDELPGAIGKVLNVAQKESGWVAMTIIGGPNPRLQGELSVRVICTGETPAGNNFETAFPNFDNVIVDEFYEFLRAVFPADVRAACALTDDSEDVVIEETPKSDNVPEHDKVSASQAKPKVAKKKQPKKTAAKSIPETPAPAADAPVESVPCAPAGIAPSPLHLDSTPTTLDPAGVATLEQDEDASHSMLTDSDDPFNDHEPFPGATSDSFATLERASMLSADWSWAEFAAGQAPPSSDGSAGVESSKEEAFHGIGRSSPVPALSPAPAPPVSSPLESAPASSPSTPLPAPSTISSPTPQRSSASSDGATSGLFTGTPPSSLDHTALTTRFQYQHNERGLAFHQRRRSTLFEAFNGNAPSLTTVPFSFAGPSPSLTRPRPAPAPTSSVAPTAAFLFGSHPLPPSTPSSSSFSTPPRQPTRAAQLLTSFLSPERRAGATPVGPAVMAALPAVEALAPPPLSASAAVGNGSMSVPVLPKTHPAAKQPVEKIARVEKVAGPVLKRGRPTKAAVLLNTTNAAIVSTDGANASTAPDAVMDAPSSRNTSARRQNTAAEPPPPAEKKREGRVRRVPVRADGTAAVGWKKRTSDEMNADTEGLAQPQAGRKKRKTSAA
ncbi:hypothetical protein C8J57DRAFT_1471795 [Mycena rebaudengoi]|nr:hypothetical protein C8J57DRAFT_1471795 [Mycena rebaudengoi]